MLTCSAVITTCNRPKLVMRAARSVLQQTRAPSELVIVDDCSDTSPHEKLESLRGNFHIRLLKLGARQGVQAARNAGARAASGDILMFLDDDDEWAPTKCEAQLKLYQTNPAVGWTYTGLLAFDETSDQRRLLHRSTGHLSGWVWPDILFRNFVGVTSALAVRRDLFERVGGFDPLLPAMQDYDLFVRLAKISPVMYDGGHNLNFSAVTSGPRVSRNIQNYYRAVEYLSRKYEPDLYAAPPTVRRRMRSQFQLLLASKHLEQRQYRSAAGRLGRAVLEYPRTGTRLFKAAFHYLVPMSRSVFQKASAGLARDVEKEA